MQATLEDTLASLIAIPSVPDNSSACHAIINFVDEELKMYDLFIERHSETENPWLLATTRDTKTPDILFYAHLDVVSGPEHLFQMRKENGRLLGRGVFDMKLAAACYLEFLHNHSASLSGLNIGFIFTTDEEKDSESMNEVIASGIRPKVVFLPDGGDNWAIEKRGKGFYAAELVSTGRTAHGSRPWEGENALHTLLDAIEPLREKYTLREKEHPTLMINGIQSGKAINQIPDYAVAQIDFRCFNQHEMDEYLALLTDILKKHSSVSLRVYKSGETTKFDETSPLVQEFMRAFKYIRGSLPTFCDSYGASDSLFFVPLGIPCIIIEPNGGGRHGNEEWLMADNLSLFYQLIERWITQDVSLPSIPFQHHEKVLT